MKSGNAVNPAPTPDTFVARLRFKKMHDNTQETRVKHTDEKTKLQKLIRDSKHKIFAVEQEWDEFSHTVHLAVYVIVDSEPICVTTEITQCTTLEYDKRNYSIFVELGDACRDETSALIAEILTEQVFQRKETVIGCAL